MNANERKVQEILSGASQYVIPLFQRTYSWQQKHWIRLLNDIRRLQAPSNVNQQHFMGSLVCMADAPMPGMVTGYQIIDGQQRLTTLTLLLAAIRDVASARGFVSLKEEITETYLIHRFRKGPERYKLLSKMGDREAMISIAEGKLDAGHFNHTGVNKAWRFFKRQVGMIIEGGGEQELRKLLGTVVNRLSLVFILVSGEDPYEIFESLNTTGLPLSQADLIRNFVFMQVEQNEQEYFDRDLWKPMEDEVKKGQRKDEDVLTLFFRDYLMVHGRFVDAQAVFAEFKSIYAQSKVKPTELVADFKKYLTCYLWLRKPETCPHSQLRKVFEDFAKSEIGTANPLILWLYREWQESRLTETKFSDCIRDLVSFALRRSICGEGTGTYSRWFIEAITECRHDIQNDLRQYLQRRGWPDDAVFVERLTLFPIYRRESMKALMVLLGLEGGYNHKEEVKPATLTIEHVMPQTIMNNSSGKAWKAMLGAAWEEDHENLLHVLGNLTLTGYNTPLSNHSYPEKQAIYKESHVELNSYFSDQKQWNSTAIRVRSGALAKMVARIWPRTSTGDYAPSVSVDTATVGEGKRMRYWNDFCSILQERMPVLQALELSHRSLYLQSQGDDVFVLFVYIDPKTGNPLVGLDSGVDCDKVARLLIAHLAQTRETWNDKLGFAARWLDPDAGRLVCDIDLEGNAAEEYDWPVQHIWLVPRLHGFSNILLPELDRILNDPATLRPLLDNLGEHQIAHFFYWQGFRKALKAAGMDKLRPGASTNKYFKRIISRDHFTLSAEVGSDWCGIYMQTIREDVADKFRTIQDHQVLMDVLKELGARLESQINPTGKSWLSLWKSCDMETQSDRQCQYEWMVHGISLLRDRVIPIIEGEIQKS